MRTNRLPIFAFALVAVVSLPLTARAQGDYLDTPIMSVVETSRSSVVLEITAGWTGAPAGFYIEWMSRADYLANGGWPADRYAPGVVWCDFNGTPTLNTTSGTSTYILGANETARVEIGDLFDETGVDANEYGELGSGTQYVLRIQAIGTPEWAPSYYSATQTFSTQTIGSLNCVYTQGFWKTHGPAGCVQGNNTNQWPVSSLMLGNVNYSAAQLCAIFNTPAQGNGLISLAHQLIAAKLNQASSAIPSSQAMQSILSANAAIGSLVVPPIGSGFLSPGGTNQLTNDLDRFNNGLSGPPHCGTTTPAPSATWGQLKTRYR